MGYNLEILAPAGTYDICTAVISAGADAVYLGGDMFGARAYAGNFNTDELLKALDYAHIRGKRIYLTVNTLLKQRELKEQLVEYLAPFYEAGLDAVIVQDMGVFKTVRDNFPKLPIHASTQMTVTGSEGALLLKDMGASRIVTARELSLSEIKSIHNRCDIEIESFVHGALCYCYSGQCLFSSMNGARSGNRGRCAQPCRMAYDVLDKKSNIVNQKEGKYVLSPKDMCALDILPDIAEAGVYSLKIEGRMKNVTYAAGVTSVYRKYVDLLNEKGREGYKVDKQDISDLMDMYNRGAFTTGYYNNNKGKSMISLSRPNHMGVKALEVIENVSGRIKFKALVDINPQDVFEIDSDNSFASGEKVKMGGNFVVNLPRKYNLTKGKQLFRTRNNRITQYVAGEYAQKDLKVPVKLSVFAHVGQPLNIMAECYLESIDENFVVSVSGNVVEPAQKQPTTEEKVKQQVIKLGNTDYVATEVIVELSGKVFLPVSELNDLRRQAVEQMSAQILAYFRRTHFYEVSDSTQEAGYIINNAESYMEDIYSKEPKKSVLLNDKDSLYRVLMDDSYDKSFANGYKDVYIEYTLLDYYSSMCDKLHLKGAEVNDRMQRVAKECDIRIILALPHILREKNDSLCKRYIKKAVDMGIDTFLVRNLEELGLVASVCNGAKVVLDANLYVWNVEAVKQYVQMASKLGINIIRVTLPYELKKDELAELKNAINNAKDELTNIETELIVCSRIPLMVSEQCLRRTVDMCDKKNNTMFIKDKKFIKEKKGQANIVQSFCDYCYSVVYSDIYDISNENIDVIGADVIRYEIIQKDIDKVTMKCFDGHFNVGVE